MRAVNLIPVDSRPGGGAGAAGRSGGAVYIMLGALAVLVALVAVWALSGKSLNDKRNELTRLKAETRAAQTQAAELADFGSYSTLRAQRVSTIRSLATSRFEWAQALDAISRTMPSNAWLTSMTGTAAPGVSVDGGGSAANGLRGTRSVPAIELVGCTTSQANVARLISRLSAVPGVDRVSIADSKKGDGSSSGSDACRGTHPNYPAFDMVVFFGNNVPPAGLASAEQTGATTTGTASSPTTAAPAAAGAAATTTPTSTTSGTAG
jgi:Tfp pilus assembly protein PilN